MPKDLLCICAFKCFILSGDLDILCNFFFFFLCGAVNCAVVNFAGFQRVTQGIICKFQVTLSWQILMGKLLGKGIFAVF